MGRPKSKCGIKDIARECGVSLATVSRVFHQHPNVNESIRDRVFLAAEKFNYKHEHKSLKKVIGIILPDVMTQPFGVYQNVLIPLLIKQIHKLGYGSLLMPIDDLYILKRYFVYGAVAIAFDDNVVSNWDNEFNIPLVVMHSPGKKLESAYSINSNEEQGMYIAVKHLVENGHRKIGLMIDGYLEMSATKRKRYDGYMKAVKAMNCVVDKELIQMSGDDEIMTAVGRIIRSGATAIICSGESRGYKIDYILNLFLKKIPDEISIITFENITTSEFCSPPHTTLCQNFETMAQDAINLVDQAIKNPSEAQDIIVDYRLIERESVKTIMTL